MKYNETEIDLLLVKTDELIAVLRDICNTLKSQPDDLGQARIFLRSIESVSTWIHKAASNDDEADGRHAVDLLLGLYKEAIADVPDAEWFPGWNERLTYSPA